jgi:hypothetical protein
VIARIALFFAVILVASTAHAERCGHEGRAWVARCAQSSGVAMELEACPAGVAIVSTREVRVEISTSPAPYQRVGVYGVSPIGDFPDWKLEPVARRRAFDAVVRCVESEPPVPLLTGDVAPARARSPWLLAAGVALALVACVRRSRATVLAAIAVLATVLVRHWLEPFAFFHQNGQGPLWIEYAFRGDAGEYGPGYPEIFGLVSHVRRPERGVALLQEAMAATVPLSGYAIARASKATRTTALVTFAALVFDPVLLRIARSESYFSAIVALLFAAAAVLATTDRRHRWVGLAAASLLVAQAARVHPLAWIPAAFVPLVLFCRPGRIVDRARRTGLAAVVIGVVTTPLLLPAMRASLRGHLGTEFLPAVRAILGTRGLAAGLVVALAIVLAALPATRRLGTRVAVLATAIASALVFDVLKNDAAVVRAADLHLFLPAAIAAVAFVRVRGVACVIAALAIAHAVRERRMATLPTDARELNAALQWREDLPPGAEVASLGRVDQRLLPLPLLGAGLPTWHPIDAQGHARFESGPRYYYRSSLCATPEGAPVCARFEQEHHLRALWSRRFPSMASLPWAPLPPGEIEVGLFAVE